MNEVAVAASEQEPVAAEAEVATEVAPTPAAPTDISRDDAIAQLSAQAFLGFGDAACVIDALFAKVGVYDFTSAVALEQGNQPQLIETCLTGEAGASSGASDTDDEDRSGLVVREVQTALPDSEPSPERSAELVEASPPAFIPGALATGSVELGGRTVEYVTVTPPGFEPGASAPVLIAFPPGGQDLEITRNVADFVYLRQAVERGWVVISPASPGGRWWDTNNAKLMPEMLRWIEGWVSIEGGLPHVGGMSSGGTSAFTMAANSPSAFRSLMVYPGNPDTAARRDLSDLSGIPVRMWVGGDDTALVAAMEDTAADLVRFGGDVELQVIPGEPHVIQSIADGVDIFNELDAAR